METASAGLYVMHIVEKRGEQTVLTAGVEHTNTPILVNSNPFELDTATSHASCQSSTFKATSPM